MSALLNLKASCRASELTHYPPAPKPAGARNALIRGQSVTKYESDFRRGWTAECATHYILKANGFNVSDVDLSSTMNRHAPDLTVTAGNDEIIKIQVKLASVYGGVTSWVFEKTAVARLSGVLALVEQRDDTYHVEFVAADYCQPLMRPLQRSWLNTKVALYKEDLGA